MRTRLDRGHLRLNTSSSLTALPTSFTFGFWFIMKSDGTSNMTKDFDLMNAFGRLYFYANYSGSSIHTLSTRFIINPSGNSNTNENTA